MAEDRREGVPNVFFLYFILISAFLIDLFQMPCGTLVNKKSENNDSLPCGTGVHKPVNHRHSRYCGEAPKIKKASKTAAL